MYIIYIYVYVCISIWTFTLTNPIIHPIPWFFEFMRLFGPSTRHKDEGPRSQRRCGRHIWEEEAWAGPQTREILRPQHAQTCPHFLLSFVYPIGWLSFSISYWIIKWFHPSSVKSTTRVDKTFSRNVSNTRPTSEWEMMSIYHDIPQVYPLQDFSQTVSKTGWTCGKLVRTSCFSGFPRGSP